MRSKLILMAFVALLLAAGVAGATQEQGSIEKVRGDIVVAKDETIKEASAVQGNITVYGHVTGDASAVMGNVEVKPGGSVDRDATAVMGNLTVRSGGRVGGDATAVMGSVIQESGGTIGGSKTGVGPMTPNWSRGWFDWMRGVDSLLVFSIVGAAILLAQVLVAVLIVALFPQRMSTIAECTLKRPGWSVLYGLVGLMAAVPIALILLVTCVGIPFIGVEAALLYIMWIVGAVGVKLAVGQKLGEAVNRPFRSLIWAVVVGSIVLGIVRYVPFVGGVIVSALLLFGFGAVIMTGFGADLDWFSRRCSRTQPPIQPTPPPTDAPQGP